ncbi:MAG: hypothetical protein V4439_03190 [Patescibacteria group bacterium]
MENQKRVERENVPKAEEEIGKLLLKKVMLAGSINPVTLEILKSMEINTLGEVSKYAKSIFTERADDKKMIEELKTLLKEYNLPEGNEKYQYKK